MLQRIQALFLDPDLGGFLRIRTSYKKIVTIAACCVAITSCSQLAMEDVSSTAEYSRVIGKTFKTREDLWAIGVTADKNYQKRVDYIVLVPGVGFSGPEVVTKEQVRKGAVFRVVRVLKASSFVSSKVVYVVQNIGTDKFKGVAIRVEQTGGINDRNFGLDELIYETE